MARDVIGAIAPYQPFLWMMAVLFYGIFDLLLTTAGLSVGATEAHPLVGDVVEEYVLLAMIPLKLASFGVCYAVWRVVPSPYRLGVPLGLALLGLVVTGWNLGVVTMLLVS